MRRSIVVCSILLEFSTSILYASSQQVAVRLNGGRTPFEGRVDVRRDGENSWRYVCGTGAGWNLTVARAVCKHLGYPAVMWEWHNGEFCGEDLSSASFLCDIRCNPLSDSLEDCSLDWDNNGCQCHQQNIAGVTCYQLNFLGRYKESQDRIFQPNTLRQIPPNDFTIEECIKVCRDRQKTIAVLESGDECYCGDESVDYWRYGEAIPGLPILPDTQAVQYNTEQCSGDNGTSPYKQGCGGNWQLDVYNASFQIKDAETHQPAPECTNEENGDIEVQQNHSNVNESSKVIIGVGLLIIVVLILAMVYVIYRRWCLKSANQMREEHTRMRGDDLIRRLSAGNTPAVTRREARDAARYFAFVNPIGGLNRNTPDTSHDAAALRGQQQNITDTRRLTTEYESLGPANTPSTLGESTSLHMEEEDTIPSSFNPYAQVDSKAVVGAFSAVATTRNESDQGAYGPSEPKTYAHVDKKKDSATDKPDDGSPPGANNAEEIKDDLYAKVEKPKPLVQNKHNIKDEVSPSDDVIIPKPTSIVDGDEEYSDDEVPRIPVRSQERLEEVNP